MNQSDTPRTDEAAQGVCNQNRLSPHVPASFARQLERDLIRLSAEREKEREELQASDEHQTRLAAALAERDKELAEVKATWNEFLNCNPNSPFATIEKLTAQLLAAQTVNGRMREALEDIEYSYNPSKANQIARKALSLTPDPTLLDEVVGILTYVINEGKGREFFERELSGETNLMFVRAVELLSRLRPSTRETEEKV